MNVEQSFRKLLLASAVASLVACGGGSGGGGDSSITATGVITGFGSIFVNGVEFETGQASVSLDDDMAGEDDLRLGMYVTVTGSVSSDGLHGEAFEVEFDDEVQGPIEAVEEVSGSDGDRLAITVLGITVIADRVTTVFDDGATFEGIRDGSYSGVIEVSGFPGEGGVLLATRIEGKGEFDEGLSEVEIKGVAASIDGTQFVIGDITVETAGADLSEVPGGVVTEGMLVEVKGTLSGTLITATEVDQEDDLFDADHDKVSIEGVITDYLSDSNFKVAGRPVDASGAVLEPFSLVLGNGVEVEVEGPVVNGILQAVQVEARGGDIELEAAVESTSLADNTITLQYFNGTVTVHVDSQTSLRDDFGLFDPYTLADVSATDFLEVRARLDGNGDIVATEIRRDEADDDSIEGAVDSCDGTSVTVLGVSFSLLDGTTGFENEDEAQVYENAADFCADVNLRGLSVEVEDDWPADGVADQVELEDHSDL